MHFLPLSNQIIYCSTFFERFEIKFYFITLLHEKTKTLTTKKYILPLSSVAMCSEQEQCKCVENEEKEENGDSTDL